MPHLLVNSVFLFVCCSVAHMEVPEEPVEEPWVTEASVMTAEAVRKQKADDLKCERIKQRRLKMAIYKNAGYALDPVSDDDGRPDDALFTGDKGFDEANPVEVRGTAGCLSFGPIEKVLCFL
jgi:hypothetical protein